MLNLNLKELSDFAEWVMNEGFKYDGIRIWTKPSYSAYNHSKPIFYSTQQVVEEYVRSKRQSTNTS